VRYQEEKENPSSCIILAKNMATTDKRQDLAIAFKKEDGRQASSTAGRSTDAAERNTGVINDDSLERRQNSSGFRNNKISNVPLRLLSELGLVNERLAIHDDAVRYNNKLTEFMKQKRDRV
jgi:hypothetical protein